jgi:hypothetical protein
MVTALVTQPQELKPNPLPYGRLPLRTGAWDYLLARKAYEEGDDRNQPSSALDKKV